MAAGQPTSASFNGADSYAPANGYDAPIFRQFAFVEGRVTQYHVLKPGIFRIDDHASRIYQFPACEDLAPVLQRHAPDHDAPTREIVDVLVADCMTQPRSEAEVLSAALQVVPRGLWVNAPKVPAHLADVPDASLFNGPPYRPRVMAYEEGVAVKFLTYEASWMPTWVGTNFPAHDADVFVISYGAVFRPGWTILNTAAGTPLDPGTFQKYSPIWRANCIVDASNPVCGSSVTLADPAYFQCTSVEECLSMRNSQGQRVLQVRDPHVSHINCPMVAVDVTLDGFISVPEELVFPDLWVNGPVLVV